MKLHPSVVEGQNRLDDQKDIDDRVSVLCKAVKSDQDAMRDFLTEQAYYRWRRYGAGDPGRRGVTSPWLNASDIVYNMSEVYCGQTDAAFMQMLFGNGSRHVRCTGYDEAAHKNVKNVEAYMNAWASGGGIHAQSDLKLQAAMLIGSMTQTGAGVLRDSYEYLCRVEGSSIRRSDLPGILSRISIVPTISEPQRHMMMQTIPGLNTPDILAFYGVQEPVQPLNAALAAQFMPRIRQEVISQYGLDLEEPIDREALADILDYIKSGTKDRSHTITVKQVLADGPRLHSVERGDLFMPMGTRLDLSRAGRIAERLRFGKEQFATLGEANDWRNIDEVIACDMDESRGGNLDDPLEVERRTRTKMNNPPDSDAGIVTVMMVHHYEPLTGELPEMQGDAKFKGRPMRLVCTLFGETSEKVIAKYPVRGGMPYTGFYHEAKSDDYFEPRSIPKMLRDPESHATAIYRTLENVMTLISYPTFQAKRSKFTEAEGFEIPPGGVVLVDNAGDIQQMPMQSNTFPAERLLQNLMSWPEGLIGGTDMNLTDDEHLERPRTATQMGMINSATVRVRSMKGMLFLDSYAMALRRVLNQFQMHGPDEFFVGVAGAPPMKLSMAKIRGDMDVLPWPSVGDMDPNYRKQQAQLVFQTLMQVMPVLTNDPTVVPQPAIAARRLMEELDPNAAKSILPEPSDEQMQAFMQRAQVEQQKAQQMADIGKAAEAQNPLTPDQIQALQDYLGELTGRKELQMVYKRASDMQASTDQAALAMAHAGG